jgi:hypothetical protein
MAVKVYIVGTSRVKSCAIYGKLSGCVGKVIWCEEIVAQTKKIKKILNLSP